MNCRRAGAALVLAATLPAIVLGLGGCRSSGTKAGPATPPVVLHLATVEDSAAPYAPDVRRFADEVEALTKGSVTIQIDFGGAGPYVPETEQTLTAMVKDGRTDLGVVPPRVFDTVGIHGFEALQTPFLIDSPELASAITTGDIATGLLAGLSDDGVAGLGLWYNSLRRPLAITGALTQASQISGLVVRVPISGVGWDVFKALGAVPDYAASHLISTSGKPYSLVETDIELALTDFVAGTTMTANVVFYPKFNVLLANPATFGRLTSEQQDALRQAARDTAVAAVATTADDEALAEAFCQGGGHVLLAARTEVDALRARAASVGERLRADPVAGPLIEEVEKLKQTVTAEYVLPPACAPRTGDGANLPTTAPPPAPQS